MSNSEDDVEVLSWGVGQAEPLFEKDKRKALGKHLAKAMKMKTPEKPTLDGIHILVADGSVLDMRMEENQIFAIKSDQFKLLEDYYSGPFHPIARMVYARRRVGRIYFRDIVETTQWGILMRRGISSESQACLQPQTQGKQTLTHMYFDSRVSTSDIVDAMCGAFDHIPGLTYNVSSDQDVFTINVNRRISETEFEQYIKIEP
jgi:hypothetical protein